MRFLNLRPITNKKTGGGNAPIKNKIMTIHETRLNNRIFYINRKRDGSLNYNSVNEKTNRTFHYKTGLKYYEALKRAK